MSCELVVGRQKLLKALTHTMLYKTLLRVLQYNSLPYTQIMFHDVLYCLCCLCVLQIAALKKELCNPLEFILLDNSEKMEVNMHMLQFSLNIELKLSCYLVVVALVSRLSVRSVNQFKELSFHRCLKQRKKVPCLLALVTWRKSRENHFIQELTTPVINLAHLDSYLLFFESFETMASYFTKSIALN